MHAIYKWNILTQHVNLLEYTKNILIKILLLNLFMNISKNYKIIEYPKSKYHGRMALFLNNRIIFH